MPARYMDNPVLAQQVDTEPFGFLPPALASLFIALCLRSRRNMSPIGGHYQHGAPAAILCLLASSSYLFSAGYDIFQAGTRTYLFECIVHEMVAENMVGKFRKQFTAAGKRNLCGGSGRLLLNVKLVFLPADLKHLVQR